MDRVIQTLTQLSQLFTDIPQSLKYSILFSIISALPFVPHPKKFPQLPALPQGIERVYVMVGNGKGSLELLIPRPATGEDRDLAPLLFVHGGYGSTFCWKNWIPYLAGKGRTVYTLSLSGKLRFPYM